MDGISGPQHDLRATNMSYVRIPGKKKGFYRRCTLWMGDDHLLLVESSGYTEQYKRLHYKDIQAVIIQETTRKRDLNILFTAFAFLAATPSLIQLDVLDSLLSFLGIITSATFLLALLVNIHKGQTCLCRIQMPLANHEVPSLGRQKHVHALLDRLKPEVERFQGRISREDMKASLYRMSLSRSRSRPSTSPYAPSQLPTLNGEPARLHWIAFGCLLLDVVLTYLVIHNNSLMATVSSTLMSMAMFALLVTGVVRQRKTQIPGIVKTLTWTALVLLTLYSLFCWIYVYATFILAQRVDVFRDQWALLSAISQLELYEHPLLVKVMMGYAATSLVIGFSGLAALLTDYWPRKSSGPGLNLGASTRLHQGR
jgi:hypothetical protein